MFHILFKFMSMKKLAREILEADDVAETSAAEAATAPAPVERDGEGEKKPAAEKRGALSPCCHKSSCVRNPKAPAADDADNDQQLTNAAAASQSSEEPVVVDEDEELLRAGIGRLATERQWQVVAIMVDRLFLVLFVVITVSVIGLILVTHNGTKRVGEFEDIFAKSRNNVVCSALPDHVSSTPSSSDR